MTITLPIYYEIVKKTKKNQNILVWLNWYRNAHHSISNKIKHHYHNLVAEQLWDSKFEQIRPYYKVYMAREWTDWHNIRSVIEKFFLDWLVENWNIVDDTRFYVPWDNGSEYHIDKNNPRIEIII